MDSAAAAMVGVRYERGANEVVEQSQQGSWSGFTRRQNKIPSSSVTSEWR